MEEIIVELLKVFAPMIMLTLKLTAAAVGDDDRSDPAAPALVEARAHAGRGAVDCGRAKSTDAAALDTCLADALLARKPFVGVLVEQGIDSAVGRVYAGNASGDVRELHFDSDPSGGGGAHPSVYITRCPTAHVEVVDQVRRITCPNDHRGPAVNNTVGQPVYK